MTTSTLEVGDLFSVLDSHGIARQLRSVARIGRVSVNTVWGTPQSPVPSIAWSASPGIGQTGPAPS